MPSKPESAEPRGLVRSLTGLFQGRPPESVPLPDSVSGRVDEDALLASLGAFVRASPAEREDLGWALLEAGSSAGRDPGREVTLTEVVERLARLEGSDGAASLARQLTTPRVARRITDELRAASRDEARRGELVGVAGRLGPTMARALALGLEEAEDRSQRRALLDALVRVAPRAPDVVTDMIADPRWFVVRNGVAVLGEMASQDSIEPLTTVLAHQHPRVRREAIMALARLGSEDATQLILGMLEDPDVDVRAAAAMAVGVLGAQRAVRPLLDLLEREENVDVQVEILRSLGQLGDPGAVPAIEKRATSSIFSRSPVPLRIAAFRALGAIGTPHAKAVLAEGLEARDPEVRAAVRAVVRDRARS